MINCILLEIINTYCFRGVETADWGLLICDAIPPPYWQYLQECVNTPNITSFQRNVDRWKILKLNQVRWLARSRVWGVTG